MPAASTCTLELWFTGLCMFVPYDSHLWVLMPDAIYAGTGTAHYPRLIFGGSFNGTVDLTSLEKRQLDLSSIGNRGTRPLPSDIVNPGRMVGSPVRSDCIQDLGPNDTLPDCLAARVKLPGDVNLSPCSVVELKYGTTKQRTAGAAFIRIPDFELGAGDTLEIVPGLHLGSANGRIQLLIANLPELDYLHKPPTGMATTHFQAYGALLDDGSALKRPSKPNASVPVDHPCVGSPIRTRGFTMTSMDPYTCMVGGGCPIGSDNC